MSLFASTERISFADAVPRVVPERRLSSSGVAEIVVVDGVVKGTSVPELSARLIVLSAVGSIAPKYISKSSILLPSNVKELTVTELTPVKSPSFIVKEPLVNVPSILRFLIPVISLFASMERISFAVAVPRIVPERRLISSGVAEMVVVEGLENGISVPSEFAKLMFLSCVGSIAFKLVLMAF